MKFLTLAYTVAACCGGIALLILIGFNVFGGAFSAVELLLEAGGIILLVIPGYILYRKINQ